MKGPGDPDELILNAIQGNLSGRGMVTGFVLIAEYTDDDGDSRIICDSMTGQVVHRSMGLLQFGLAIENARAAHSWFEDEDDD